MVDTLEFDANTSQSAIVVEAGKEYVATVDAKLTWGSAEVDLSTATKVTDVSGSVDVVLEKSAIVAMITAAPDAIFTAEVTRQSLLDFVQSATFTATVKFSEIPDGVTEVTVDGDTVDTATTEEGGDVELLRAPPTTQPTTSPTTQPANNPFDRLERLIEGIMNGTIKVNPDGTTQPTTRPTTQPS